MEEKDKQNESKKENAKDVMMTYEPELRDEFKKDYKVSPFEKYQRKFSSSLSTVVLGVLLLVIGFVILGYSEGLNSDTSIVRRTPTINVKDLKATEGTVKLIGSPKTGCNLGVEECKSGFFYYQVIEEKNVDGLWLQKRNEEIWGDFQLGEIQIRLRDAKKIFDLQKIYEEENEEEGTRKTIYGVSETAQLIVFGELKDSIIQGGNVFIVTNKTKAELDNFLMKGQWFSWWIYKLAAIILLTLGFWAFIIPILGFLDIVTKFGGFLGIGILFISFIVSCILVLLTTLVLIYWWLLFILLALIIILIVRIKSTKKTGGLGFIP